MKYIVLNGKKRRIKATVGAVRKILKHYGNSINESLKENREAWEGDSIIDFSIDIIWEFLEPNFLGLKPYLTKKRFERKVDIDDVRGNFTGLMEMLFGAKNKNESEDREPGN